jgi:hypothetical protein
MNFVIAAVTILFVTITLGASSAYAVQPGTMKGTSATYGNAGKAKCPAGTCSKAGTSWAQDVRYCSAANCKK